MRRYLDETESEITGWKKRPTKRPTSFMMTTKFLSILVAKSGRELVKPLKPVQLEYLQALGVNPKDSLIFERIPCGKNTPKPIKKGVESTLYAKKFIIKLS